MDIPGNGWPSRAVTPIGYHRTIMRTSAHRGTVLIALMGMVACLSGGSCRSSVSGSGAASAGAAEQGPVECRDSPRGSSCSLATAGVRGTCMDTSACAALGGYVSTPGRCSGPANIACCTSEPHYEGAPAGYKILAQPRVTPEMVAWAAMIVESSSIYCMGSTAQQTFGGVSVLARVEWHPPEPSHDSIHRGVTLYEPDHARAVTAVAGGM